MGNTSFKHTKAIRFSRAKGAGAHLLDQAVLLSQYMYFTLLGNMEALGDLLVTRCSTEPDTVCAVLIRFKHIQAWKIADRLTRASWCDLANICLRLRGSSFSPRILEVAQDNLSELLEAFDWLGSTVFSSKGVIGETEDYLNLLNGNKPPMTSTPGLFDADLRVRGSILASWCTNHPYWPGMLRANIVTWIQMLHQTVDERTVSLNTTTIVSNHTDQTL